MEFEVTFVDGESAHVVADAMEAVAGVGVVFFRDVAGIRVAVAAVGPTDLRSIEPVPA